MGGNWALLPAVITPLNQGCNPITMQSAMRAPAPRLTELTEDVEKSSDEIWQNSGDVLSLSLSLIHNICSRTRHLMSLQVSHVITVIRTLLVNNIWVIIDSVLLLWLIRWIFHRKRPIPPIVSSHPCSLCCFVFASLLLCESLQVGWVLWKVLDKKVSLSTSFFFPVSPRPFQRATIRL